MPSTQPSPLADLAPASPARPWLIAGSLNLPNRMLKALWKHIQTLCYDDQDGDIDSPFMLSDHIEEWLATEGKTFTGCRPEAVLVLPLKYYEAEGLGIYYHNTNNVDLITVAGIAWRENAEKAWLNSKPLN